MKFVMSTRPISSAPTLSWSSLWISRTSSSSVNHCAIIGSAIAKLPKHFALPRPLALSRRPKYDAPQRNLFARANRKPRERGVAKTPSHEDACSRSRSEFGVRSSQFYFRAHKESCRPGDPRAAFPAFPGNVSPHLARVVLFLASEDGSKNQNTLC